MVKLSFLGWFPANYVREAPEDNNELLQDAKRGKLSLTPDFEVAIEGEILTLRDRKSNKKLQLATTQILSDEGSQGKFKRFSSLMTTMFMLYLKKLN